MADFSKIMAISGMPGLFELVASRANGAIVRSLEDGRTQFVSNRNQQLMLLKNLEMLLQGERSIPLREVLQRIQQLEPELAVPDPKAEADVLKQFLEKVLPEYDRQRVHVSDMRRLVRWYLILKQRQSIPTDTEPQTQQAGEQPAAGS